MRVNKPAPTFRKPLKPVDRPAAKPAVAGQSESQGLGLRQLRLVDRVRLNRVVKL